jgi:hypothetical protein
MTRRFPLSTPALAALSVLVLLAPAAPALAARDRGRRVDLITTAADFASYEVRSIAMLPVATFDRNSSAEHTVAAMLAQDLRTTGYRWVSADLAREMLGDSVTRAVRDDILKNLRVDSLSAPRLCARLRTRAVLSLRVDQWEQQPLLWNQTGKPTSTVQLKAALVDSTGRLLWSASGSETGEGPYHDPTTNPIAVTGSGLENTPMTGQGGPPPLDEVLGRLLLRWVPQFPGAAAASAPAR